MQKWLFIFKLIYKFNLFSTLQVLSYLWCGVSVISRACSGKRKTQISKTAARRDAQSVQLSRPETWNHNDKFPYMKGLRLFISTVFASTYACTSSFRAEVSLYSTTSRWSPSLPFPFPNGVFSIVWGSHWRHKMQNFWFFWWQKFANVSLVQKFGFRNKIILLFQE